MEETSSPVTPEDDRAWNVYVLFLLVVVGFMMFVNLTGVRISRRPMIFGTPPRQSITIGDITVDAAVVAPSSQRRQIALQAVAAYRDALPLPSARRRLEVLKEWAHQPGGFEDLAGLGPNERAMWQAIYGNARISIEEANAFARQISRLNLGPLKPLAISQVYAKAGEVAASKSYAGAATAQATRLLTGLALVAGIALVAGVVGLILIVVFLSIYGEDISSAPRLTRRPLTALRGFVFYLVSFILLEAGIGGFLALALPARLRESTVAALVGDSAAMFIAIGLGLAALVERAGPGGRVLREIGLTVRCAGREVIWGVGGYCALLPLVLVAALVSMRIFRNVQTPQHPLVHLVAGGGPVVFGIVLLMASVAAPLVEETAFRGMLYTSLRGKMGVWPAACASSAVFAAIHPILPAGFLPIFALGLVFALQRERSGSLLPSMITHGMFNFISLLAFWLLN